MYSLLFWIEMFKIWLHRKHSLDSETWKSPSTTALQLFCMWSCSRSAENGLSFFLLTLCLVLVGIAELAHLGFISNLMSIHFILYWLNSIQFSNVWLHWVQSRPAGSWDDWSDLRTSPSCHQQIGPNLSSAHPNHPPAFAHCSQPAATAAALTH